MGNILSRKCENCGFDRITKYYCKQCGYPTHKKLNKVKNPQDEINRALSRPDTKMMRVKYHGYANVLKEDGLL